MVELYFGMPTQTHDASRAAPSAPAIDQLVKRVHTLYTLPAVAAQVIQLTANPKVDTQALKECIQTDPALTFKILRVVNSSLFGMSHQVSDLNQALALLGVKPLKLLVLGFSLPEALFRDVAAEQLNWYWTTTLNRAVAARAISEEIFGISGDEAFLAGLLQDIGVLVLLGQLQLPYAEFLSQVIHQQADLRHLELEALGFSHQELTGALLEHWRLPAQLVKAITEPRLARTLAKDKSSHAALSRILHLADLTSELVGHNRLDVLPDLVETGELYGQLDHDRLLGLVAVLQPQVQALADVLALQLPAGQSYDEVIQAAHVQLSVVAESVAEPLSRLPAATDSAEQLLGDTAALRSAVDDFLQQAAAPPAPEHVDVDSSAPEDVATVGQDESLAGEDSAESFLRRLTFLVGDCRSKRQAVSVVLLGCRSDTSTSATEDQSGVDRLLDAMCHRDDVADKVVRSVGPGRRSLILPGFDKQQAVYYTQTLIEKMQSLLDCFREQDRDIILHAGVASVILPAKNFPPQDLLTAAQRCLKAAQKSATHSVKSLEVC